MAFIGDFIPVYTFTSLVWITQKREREGVKKLECLQT